MTDPTTEDPRAILDRVQQQATRHETPCGDGKMIWHQWDQSNGTAPIVVLCHGGAGSWRHWIRTIPALVPTYRVVIPDLPGLGESDFPPVADDAFAVAAIVADGIDAIVGANATYDIVGFSFGGTMAACIGALRGKRVRSVTIIGASGVAAAGSMVTMEKVRHLDGEARRETHRTNLGRLMIADPAKIDDLALEIQDWNTIRSRLRSPGLSRSGAILKAIDQLMSPLNGIWGELDASGNPKGAERVASLRQRCPEADLRLLPGVGHWAAYEAAERVNPILLEMLARTRPVAEPSPTSTKLSTGPGEMIGNAGPGMLAGLRVVEIADERAEYTGLLLAGLGAEVIKIEPPGGNATRRIGPFLEDEPGPNRSLFFWTYNRGKKSVILDIQRQPEDLLPLLEGADILLDSSCGALNRALDLDRDQLNARFPKLITARMTPFGDDGPWADFQGSDLIHLALGGVMMNCGYDPDPNLDYDTPPIAPQVWHAYHIAGEQLATGIIAALIARHRDGTGQDVSVAVHEAVSKNPELDIMHWVMRRVPLWRLTCRHALEVPNHSPSIMHTKDGRWFISHGMGARDLKNLVPLLSKYGMQADLQPPPPDADLKGRAVPGSTANDEAKSHMIDVVQRFARAWTYKDMPWLEAQDAGLLWAPIRKPHENALDAHWLQRKTFADVYHPEHGRSFRYPTSKWLTDKTSWQIGRRAPLVGEDTHAVLAESPRAPSVPAEAKSPANPVLSAPHGKPFPLQGVKILDFAWFLASAGGTRFLAALGAESYKVEWKDNPDTRLAAMAPVGGRAARDAATGPLKGVTDPDMGGQFNNKNAGKRGISLNIRHSKGLAIAKDLVRICDIVAEGFSPGVLQRLGLGYDVMKKIRPDIIYIQQAGMGAHGVYGRMRTVGPVAAAFGGQADMSGLPEPAMPVGWGYSYLDWMGAYGYALALLGALYHRDRTGEGQWIDASQCESGIFLTGAQILDWSANGRVWTRYGNRSPYKPAAPHGAYRCKGKDRWVAIACFTDQHWHALARVANHTDWLDDRRFDTLESRLAHQDALDALMESWTLRHTAEDVMYGLQGQMVPAGVCQNAEDRCDNDPQLRHLRWLTEVTGTKIGTWPVYELPMKMSRTPAYIGGPIDRGAPGYGEDNEWLLTNLLGMSKSDVERLAEEGVI